MTDKFKKRIHPRERASLLSRLTFFYTFKIFKDGYRKDLEQDDLYEVLTTCQSKSLGDQIEFQWEKERKKYKRPSILRVLWACFGKTYLLFGLMQLTMRTILLLTLPEALGRLVSYFTPGQTNLSKEDAYCYAAVVISLNILNFIYTQNYMLALTEYSIRIRTALCTLIYRKALKMTDSSLSQISVGKIITLITKDMFAVEMIILFANDLWIGTLQIGIICFLIYRKVGVSTFSAVGFFLSVLPLQILIAKFSTMFRLKTSKKTDERLKETQETLSAIKIIRMYAWEKFFVDRIATSRKKEVNAIYILFCMKIVTIVIGGLSTNIAFYLLIMTYVWLGNYVTAEVVYFIKMCFGKLRHVLSILMPLGISFGAECCATFIRLRSVLEAEDLPSPRYHIEIPTNDPKIVFNKITVKVNNVEILKNVILTIEKGLNIITGHTGSGKTTFLKSVLQNYEMEGDLAIYGRISYASQEPWLFPSTIKENILFGEELNQKRYEKILEICQLNQDLKSFVHADSTIVGDNGANLSKGQQARINLARALYKESEIYLLDDCLAALDGRVSDKIFRECIQIFLKNKLCLFVTNNYDHIKEADKILEMKESSIEFCQSTNSNDLLKEVKNVMGELKQDIPLTADDTTKKEIYKESKKSGKVDLAVYNKYIQYGGGFFLFSLVLILFVLVQTSVSYSEKLISNWVTLEQNLSNYKEENLTGTEEFKQLYSKRTNILNIYTIVIVTATLVSLLKSFGLFSFNRKSSIRLHKNMIDKIMGAKMQFFDTHFLGNILNRFSKDLCTIDDHLPHVMYECLELFFITSGIVILVAIVNPYFLIPIAVFFTITYGLRHVYLKTGRSLQRLDASTRSPLIGHLNSSLEGLTTIRAFKAQSKIRAEFDKYQDLYTSANYTAQCCTRGFAFILDAMCSFFIALIIIRFLFGPMDTTVGNVGLAISQAFHLTGLLQHGVRRWADFESQMTSVERALEYTEIEQEGKEGKVIKSWPQEGKVEYKDVSLSYDKNKKILKNISFDIKPKQKIGIVGRTGAGKSSIISTLFRLYDVEGIISIDGVNIQEVSLNCLRTNISIIPQDPLIFTGTIRENIDPLNKYQDEEIWKVIKITGLQNVITSLSDKIDNNTNFSAGQKQLICLARVLARKNSIVVLDEATANLDRETDTLIQDVIKANFANCTVIVIAHRLVSILAADMVMVVSDGQIVERDQPARLLEIKDSLFSEMVKRE